MAQCEGTVSTDGGQLMRLGQKYNQARQKMRGNRQESAQAWNMDTSILINGKKGQLGASHGREAQG